MSDDVYASFTGGGLKLKGIKESGIKKKKKSKSKESKDKIKEAIEQTARDKSTTPNLDATTAASSSTTTAASATTAASSRKEIVQVVTKTDAERKFEEAQLRRQKEKINQLAAKSHKERVAELNEKLSKMSEHHDMPRIAGGG